MCKASITEAFYFMRKQPPTKQKHLLEILIMSALNLPASDERKRKGLELIELPFNPKEEAWFCEYLTNGSGKEFERSGDALLTRLLAQDQYDSVLEIVNSIKTSKAKVDGVKWENIIEGVNRGVGERKGLSNFKIEK
jgi:protein ELYS